MPTFVEYQMKFADLIGRGPETTIEKLKKLEGVKSYLWENKYFTVYQRIFKTGDRMYYSVPKELPEGVISAESLDSDFTVTPEKVTKNDTCVIMGETAHYGYPDGVFELKYNQTPWVFHKERCYQNYNYLYNVVAMLYLEGAYAVKKVDIYSYDGSELKNVDSLNGGEIRLQLDPLTGKTWGSAVW